MRRWGGAVQAVVLSMTLAGSPLVGPQRAGAATPTHAALAAWWAPVHHQDTDPADADADYVTKVNFDGTWATADSWQNQPKYPAVAYAYYAVVETSTHWFITYAFFHPRDWCANALCGSHENDMEGAMVVVRKGSTAMGTVDAVLTVFHNSFGRYIPDGSAFKDLCPDCVNNRPYRGTLRMRSYGGHLRPATQQESKGHGLLAWDGKLLANGRVDFPGGDGVVYYPGTAKKPDGGDDRNSGYGLIDTFATGGLWEKEMRDEVDTFPRFGVFDGNDGGIDAAHAPWAWDADNDTNSHVPGEWAVYPAHLVAGYFENVGNFSLVYTKNRFCEDLAGTSPCPKRYASDR